MLTMMFISIFLFPEVRNVFLLAGTTGIISGIFSNFPGGFIPNVVDKFITAFVIYAIIISLKKITGNLIASTVVAGIRNCYYQEVSSYSIAIFILGADLPFGGFILSSCTSSCCDERNCIFLDLPDC